MTLPVLTESDVNFIIAIIGILIALISAWTAYLQLRIEQVAVKQDKAHEAEVKKKKEIMLKIAKETSGIEQLKELNKKARDYISKYHKALREYQGALPYEIMEELVELHEEIKIKYQIDKIEMEP